MTSKMLKKIILVNLIIIISIVLVIAVKSTKTPISAVNTYNEITSATEEDKGDRNQTVISNTSPSVAPISPVTTVVPRNRCIVMVNGKRYDVTSFRNKHSGGDIFVCGTDMTAAFNSQHGSGTLNQMAPYLVK